MNIIKKTNPPSHLPQTQLNLHTVTTIAVIASGVASITCTRAAARASCCWCWHCHSTNDIAGKRLQINNMGIDTTIAVRTHLHGIIALIVSQHRRIYIQMLGTYLQAASTVLTAMYRMELRGTSSLMLFFLSFL